MSRRHRLNDPALRCFYRDLQELNKTLPPDRRVGFQTYCRQHGILAPEDIEAVRRFEVSVSDIYEEPQGGQPSA
jgi:hypothetical protein